MKCIIACVLFFSTITASAQNDSCKALIEQLISNQEPVTVFSNHLTVNLLQPPPPFNDFEQQIFNLKHRLFVNIQGTCQLYQYDSQNGMFKRIDSSNYRGYNFQSFTFVFNNQIYNLGGWGFWRVSGHLRKYNEATGNFDIVPLNKEVAFVINKVDGICYYDAQNGKIYTACYVNENEGIKPKPNESPIIFKSMVLDLNTMNWSELGNLDKSLEFDITTGENLGMTPWGLLRRTRKKIQLWDFKNNNILILPVTNKLTDALLPDLKTAITYCRDSTLFIYRNNHQLDSFNLHISDFVTSNDEIYYTSLNDLIEQYAVPISILAAIIILVIGFVVIRMYTHYKVKHALVTLQKQNKLEHKTAIQLYELFNEQEVLIIESIANACKEGRKVSIDEINAILGVKNRPLETQKSQRYKFINGINNKYMLKMNTILIKNKRSDLDARTFNYFIDEENLKLLF